MAEAAFDSMIDSLSGAVGGQAILGQGVATPSHTSPGALKDYAMDVHPDQRPAFVKSVAEDGGIVILSSPNERSAGAQQAMLAADQTVMVDGQAVVPDNMVMKPRAVLQQRGGGKATRENGAIVNSADVGLRLRPIKIQYEADRDDMGNPVNPERSKPKVFASDGTVMGGQRINELGTTTLEKKASVVMSPGAPIGSLSGVPAAAPVGMPQAFLQAAPAAKKRITYQPAGGGKIRSTVEAAVVSESIVLVIADANAETLYEPTNSTPEEPLTLVIDEKSYPVFYQGLSAEADGKLYLVFIRLA